MGSVTYKNWTSKQFSSDRPQHTTFWIVILDAVSKLWYVWFQIVNESSSYSSSGVHIVHSVNKEINQIGVWICGHLWYEVTYGGSTVFFERCLMQLKPVDNATKEVPFDWSFLYSYMCSCRFKHVAWSKWVQKITSGNVKIHGTPLQSLPVFFVV